MESVKDNYAKRDNYKILMSRLEKSLNYGCYIEAIVILYAVFEDKIDSMLYHLGIYSTRVNKEGQKYKINVQKKVKESIRLILDIEDNKGKDLSAISNKINYLTKCLSIDESKLKNNEYIHEVNNILNITQKEELLYTLKCILLWIINRNRLIHALTKINIYDSNNKYEVKDLCLTGREYIKVLDKYSKLIKRKNIRGKYKLQS